MMYNLRCCRLKLFVHTWQSFAKGLVNIQSGCQKGPLESGECDENSGNLLAMVKTESGKRNSPEGLQKLK